MLSKYLPLDSLYLYTLISKRWINQMKGGALSHPISVHQRAQMRYGKDEGQDIKACALLESLVSLNWFCVI